MKRPSTPGPPAQQLQKGNGSGEVHALLGAILLGRNLITGEQLSSAVERQKGTRRRVGQVLVDMGFTTPDAVLGALSVQLGVPSSRVNAYTIQREATSVLRERVARKHHAVPLLKTGKTLVVAMASPRDLVALDDLQFASGCQIQAVVALEDEISAALDRSYSSSRSAEPEATEADDVVVVDEARSQTAPADEETQLSAIHLLDRIIARAAADGASDIHLEPMQDAFRARFRVDGFLVDHTYMPASLATTMVARVKVLSGMDIAEHRLPQDGRFSATMGNRRLDMRTSTYPTMYGEKAVLRLLDHSAFRLQLSAVGMRDALLERFREVMHRPEGIVLITGPTGSGKTSTLYATLAELVETRRNIVTIEDPVEYPVPGVSQGQTHDKAGFTFARGLRAILRQDPDVILVGEIRDPETLHTAIEASLTGHLVFSTVHTNSAVATVTRLMDMGLEPYLLASAVHCIVAQRLVRQICANCKVAVPTPAHVEHLFAGRVPPTLHRGTGCKACRGTGYRGRTGIFELLMMNDSLRQAVLEHASEARMLEIARENGMETLREGCLDRVMEGETTLEEVVRVTQERL